MQPKHAILSVIAVLLLSMSFNAKALSAEGEPEPWRLSKALALPTWITLTGRHRSRYEALDGQFRANRSGDDRIFVFRTDLKMAINLDGIEVVAEAMDSRQHLADRETPLSTGIVNTFDLVQGYAAVNLADLLHRNSTARLQLGRLTMDVGSRRLVARNRFRNTLNTFTGISGSWKAASGRMAYAFYVLPVNRLPSGAERLLDNDTEFDRETFDVRFWGVYSRFPGVFPDVTGEFYLFGLHEDDSPDRATRNRNLYTSGLRLYRKERTGRYDFELESVFQAGESRASGTATDMADLDHAAHFQHIQVGYSFHARWSPRLILQFDYASGDRDPDDTSNNRFDTLYGARRFDFGPTGIYGAFARSNLLSPGYRLNLKPRERLNIMFAHRFYWLASDRDAWTTGGLRDPTGNAGSHLGNQAEIRIRWDAIPRNIRIETGVAHLFAGAFIENAPNTNGEGNPTYAYLQTGFTF